MERSRTKALRAWAMLPSCAILLTAGCGHFKKPSTVVHSVYMDCNNGEYPKARFLFKAELRERFNGGLTSNLAGIKGACDRLTKGGTLAAIDIAGEAIHGDTAIVYANIHFKDGSVHRAERTDLIQEDGVWKVNATQ